MAAEQEVKHTPLGSGLALRDGASYRAEQKPTAFPLPNWRWRAEISGVENGTVVRSWIGPDFATKAEALRAAIAKAEGRSHG